MVFLSHIPYRLFFVCGGFVWFWFFFYIYIKKVFHFEEENTEYHKNKNFSQASRKQSLVKILNILYFYKTIIYKVLNESKVNNRTLIFKIVFSCPWI